MAALTVRSAWGTLGTYHGQDVGALVVVTGHVASVDHVWVDDIVADELSDDDAPGYVRVTFEAVFSQVGDDMVLTMDDDAEPEFYLAGASDTSAPAGVWFYGIGTDDTDSPLISFHPVAEGDGFDPWPLLVPNGFARVRVQTTAPGGIESIGQGDNIFVDATDPANPIISADVTASEGVELGETSTTAYRGDRGKYAYDHASATGNPHGTTASSIGAVPTTRTIGGVDLSANRSATDIGAVTPTSTDTLTNKRITKRVTTITSSATPTVNTDNCDAVTITAQAAAITSMTTNLSGTPTNFQQLVYRIKDDGTPRAITWGASFIPLGVALPTTTVAGKVLTVGFMYDTVSAKWGCLAAAQEA
jgi:hypothetical protein